MKIFGSFLKPFLLLIFLLFSGLVYYQWKQFEPRLNAIKAKDPERYARMIEMIKGFELQHAKTIFNDLEAMTENEVIRLRVKNKRKAWNGSEEYRQEKLLQLDHTRQEQRIQKNESYVSIAREVLEDVPKSAALWISSNWSETAVWNKVLILRQKCVDLLIREIEREKRRESPRSLPRTATLILPKKNVIIPSQLCESWVPLNNSEKTIPIALSNLSDHLEFSQFKTLLKEVGIPEKDVIDFEKKNR